MIAIKVNAPLQLAGDEPAERESTPPLSVPYDMLLASRYLVQLYNLLLGLKAVIQTAKQVKVSVPRDLLELEENLK